MNVLVNTYYYLFLDWNKIFGEELYDHRLDLGEDVNLATIPEFNETRTLLKQQLITAFSK